MKQLPFFLVWSRVPIALAIGLVLFLEVPCANIITVVLITVGVLTDIFDGMIARKLGISTEKLRVLDSNIDQFFWIVVLGCVLYTNLQFFTQHYYWIGIVVFLEILAYVISYIRFKRTIATHSILAKIWVLTLFAWLVDLLIYGDSSWVFFICVGMGIISRLEIVAMVLWVKNWVTDIPSIFAVAKLNKGEPVKKTSLFNS